MKMGRRLIILASLLIVLIAMQNCGEYEALQDENFDDFIIGAGVSVDNNEKDQRVPFQMLSKKQVVASFVTATGVTEADASLKTTSDTFKPILSEKSELSQYNSPRAMSYANLAGSACRQLILQEKTDKNKRLIRYGLPVDASEISQQELAETIRSFARSFWSRNETQAEFQIIMESLDDHKRDIASLNQQQQAERQTLFLCTAMLSALDSITF